MHSFHTQENSRLAHFLTDAHQHLAGNEVPFHFYNLPPSEFAHSHRNEGYPRCIPPQATLRHSSLYSEPRHPPLRQGENDLVPPRLLHDIASGIPLGYPGCIADVATSTTKDNFGNPNAVSVTLYPSQHSNYAHEEQPGLSDLEGPPIEESNPVINTVPVPLVVPQERYVSGARSSFRGQDSIRFDLKDTDEPGITVADALSGGRVLQDADNLISSLSKTSISLRILWPGYPAFSGTYPAMDWKKNRRHLTRGRLAQKVACHVKAFFNKYHDFTCDARQKSWQIGTGAIQLDDLYLVALHHVSRGSWQPEIHVKRSHS